MGSCICQYKYLGKKYIVHYSSNFSINSATLLTLVTLPLRTSSTAREKVPLLVDVSWQWTHLSNYSGFCVILAINFCLLHSILFES
jgi:hypothetical protein